MASSTKGETPTDPTPILLRFDQGQRLCPVSVAMGARTTLAEYWRARWTTAAVIGDANVVGLHGDEVTRTLRRLTERVVVLDFPSGENHKTRETKSRLEDQLVEAGCGRSMCIITLGGGISIDVGGFVAATYLRGVAHINLPTSLLAMVDAAVGGKTGVNTERGKNLIGAIHQPVAVLIDPHYLSTLPPPEWAGGLAELVKHAVIADADLFAWLEAHAGQIKGPTWRGGLEPLRRSVQIKGEIVQRDEHEADVRAVLNFGHTVGHAIEKARGHSIDHGRAVAVGMLVEGRVALSKCGLPSDHLSRLRRCLGALGLPTRPPDLPFDELVPFLAVDKKRREGKLRLPLPKRLGEMARTDDGRFTLAAELAQLRAAWDEERKS